jgi:release factor glutamine methyltransferase
LSEFIKEKIKNENPKNILDIGSGSGIQAQKCIEFGVNPENLTLADINKESIKFLKTKFLNSKIIHSDLFENIKGKFNLIIFNPPYLPEDSRESEDSKLVTTGGKKGSKVINKFLTESKKHLEENGKILLLTSSLTKTINWQNYKKKLLGKKKLFFEELYVWELRII